MAVKLTIQPPNESRARIVEFDDARVAIGRSSNCDIRLPFRIVSGHHLTILGNDSAGYHIRDEHSTNGTALNGQSMAAGQNYLISSDVRLTIVDLSVDVEIVPELNAGVSLEKTGTMARQMLGEALLEHVGGDDVDSAHFRILSGPERNRRYVLPDDFERGPVADTPDAAVRIAGIPAGLEIYRDGDGFGISRRRDISVTINDRRLNGDHMLESADEIDIAGTRLRFVDPLEQYLKQLDGVAADPDEPDSAVRETAVAEPLDASKTATSAGPDTSAASSTSAGPDTSAGADTSAASDTSAEPTPSAEPTGPTSAPTQPAPNKVDGGRPPRWSIVEIGVITVGLIISAGVIYLVLAVFGLI